MTICLAPRGTCVEGVFRSRSTCRVFGRASILASPSLERSRMTKMSPAGYPAFLQYPHSGRNSNLSTNRKRKPKWPRCVAAPIAVGPWAILTGSRTRPSDWGWNRRFGPVEGRRNNHRLVTVTCIIWILQIWWLSSSPLSHLHRCPISIHGPDRPAPYVQPVIGRRMRAERVGAADSVRGRTAVLETEVSIRRFDPFISGDRRARRQSSPEDFER